MKLEKTKEQKTNKELEIKVFERVVKKDDKTYRFLTTKMNDKYYTVKLQTEWRPNFTPFYVVTDDYQIINEDQYPEIVISDGEFYAEYYNTETKEKQKL